jgi:hypothetical protein
MDSRNKKEKGWLNSSKKNMLVSCDLVRISSKTDLWGFKENQSTRKFRSNKPARNEISKINRSITEEKDGTVPLQ